MYYKFRYLESRLKCTQMTHYFKHTALFPHYVSQLRTIKWSHFQICYTIACHQLDNMLKQNMSARDMELLARQPETKLVIQAKRPITKFGGTGRTAHRHPALGVKRPTSGVCIARLTDDTLATPRTHTF